MRIIGVHDGHNASACLLEDSIIKYAIQEERMVNQKNISGFPKESIQKIMQIGDLSSEDIDFVAMASNHTATGGSRDDRLKLYGKQGSLSDNIIQMIRKTPLYNLYKNRRRIDRLNNLFNLGFKAEKIIFVDHHTCHAASAYFGSPWRNDVLVLTADGRGDGLSATVWIGNEDKIKKISETPEGNSVGDLYAKTTFLLGLVPLEHEYKLMGLSPYVISSRWEKCYEIYKNYLSVDNLKFKKKTRENTFSILPRLKKDLEYTRFDYIAKGLQKFTEDILTEWVQNAMSETNISTVCLSGGTFMNVKANKKISEIDFLKKLFVFPSCGDESNSIGAAYWVYSEQTGMRCEPISNLYLGPSLTEKEIVNELRNYEYEYEKISNIEKKIAQLLAAGEIVARCKGRMEFGARALGNRSILADPSQEYVVPIINDLIKKRDFWMPFAISIIKEREEDYIINPKKIDAPYMVKAFDTTDNYLEIKAGIQKSDKTSRPQIVTKEFSPEYYYLIKEFEKITGIGAVLNTSFNLHGYPIVYSQKEALWVFSQSGLKFLALGDYLISK